MRRGDHSGKLPDNEATPKGAPRHGSRSWLQVKRGGGKKTKQADIMKMERALVFKKHRAFRKIDKEELLQTTHKMSTTMLAVRRALDEELKKTTETKEMEAKMKRDLVGWRAPAPGTRVIGARCP